MDGKLYQLTKNDRRGPNHVHGGKKAFHNSVWDVEEQSRRRIVFILTSLDGEEGYPGNLNVSVAYSLNKDNELTVEYRATTDQPTIFNPTHHSYFNLDGGDDILKHELYINADRFTPIDKEQIPIGELRPVAETVFDFRIPTVIGRQDRSDDEQIKVGKGYNHNFVLNKTSQGMRELAARVFSPKSGIVMEIYTTEPGLQIYDCGWYDSSIIGKGGKCYGRFAGFAAETQYFPDSPNNADFPSPLLAPGKARYQKTAYKFTIDKGNENTMIPPKMPVRLPVR